MRVCRIQRLDLLWHQRSVRAQLLITIVVIDFIAALAAGGVTIFQTRNSVQIEVAASMKLADLLVQEAIQTQQHASAERVLPGLPLQLRFLRHIRISVRDLAGHTVTEHPDSSDGARDEDRGRASMVRVFGRLTNRTARIPGRRKRRTARFRPRYRRAAG